MPKQPKDISRAKELAKKSIRSVGIVEYKRNGHDLFKEVEEAINRYGKEERTTTIEDVKELWGKWKQGYFTPSHLKEFEEGLENLKLKL